MKPATSTYDGWIGRDAYDANGDKVGEITDIYYDDVTGRPEWVAVKTGLFGMKRTFVPIHGSQPTATVICGWRSTRTRSRTLPGSIPRDTCRPKRNGLVGVLRLRLRRHDTDEQVRLRQGIWHWAGRRGLRLASH